MQNLTENQDHTEPGVTEACSPPDPSLNPSTTPCCLNGLSHALRERVKELQCLYGLSELLERRDLSLNAILEQAVALLPPAWQYPELTGVRLQWNDLTVQTPGYGDTPWRLARAITIRGQQAGTLELTYHSCPPDGADTPFLPEEEALITVVAERLGNAIQQIEAEIRLRESESLLSAITQSVRDAILMMDRHGRITFWNSAAESIFGYRRDEALGRNLHDLLAPGHQLKSCRAGVEVFGTRGEGPLLNQLLDLEGVHRDGHVFPVELSLGSVRLDDGWHAVGVLRDITERKRVERAIFEREQRYRAFYEEGPDAVAIFDPESGEILEYNDQALKLLGFSREEMRGIRISDFDAMYDPEGVAARMAKLRTELRDTFETQHRTRDGAVIDVSVTAQLIETGGRPVVHCIWRDISERKRTAEDLRVSHIRLEALWGLSALREADPDTIADYIIGTLGKMTSSPLVFYAQSVHDDDSIWLQWRIGGPSGDTPTSNGSMMLPRARAGMWIELAGASGPCVYEKTTEAPGSPVPVERMLALPFSLGRSSRLVVAVANRPVSYGEKDAAQLRSFLTGIEAIVEAKQAEEALRQSEQRLRALVESANDWIWELDATGHYSYVSPHCRQILGREPEEILGQTPFDLMELEEVARVAPLFEEFLKSKRPFHRLENRIAHKDGRTVLVETNGVPLFDSRGSFTGFRGVDRDITELRTSEMALLANQERHRDILMTAMEGYWLVNEAGQLEEVNHAYCQMSGYTREELLARGIADIDVAMDTEEISRRMAAIIEQGSARFETRHRRKDGSIFDVEVCVHYRASQGQIVSFLRDISHRKHMERIQAVRLKLLENSATEPMSNLLRNTLDEAEALTNSRIGFFHFVHPDQVSLTLQAWSTNTTEHMCKADGAGAHYPIDEAGVWVDAVRERRPVIQNDYVNLPHRRGLPTGHAPITRELIVPVFRNSAIVALLGVGNKPSNYDEHDVEIVSALADWIWDIAERKRAEEERADMQTRLFQAQKMEAIGHLAGGVAHDFNNLLQVILVNTDLAKGQLAPHTPAWHELNEVSLATSRASELTRQLLAFSRRQIISPVNLNINELLNGVVKMLRRLIGEHIHLQTVCAPSVGIICADKGQIEQVIMNLCVNARDAMPQGGHLTIETANISLDQEFCREHPWARTGEYILLSVTDSGTGMDAATRAHIFEPFFTTKEVGKGTGLGLASVHGIVNQHNGFIHVYSEPGTGSVFKVYLPMVANAVVEHAVAERPAARGGHETILVAEDEPAILRMLEIVLRMAGYTVITAADGRQALEQFSTYEGNIDLVILDVMMPGLSGKAVMQQILGMGRRLPFLFSSGYSENALHTDFVIEEGLHLIQKPYGREQLLSTVREILDARQKRQGAPAE